MPDVQMERETLPPLESVSQAMTRIIVGHAILELGLVLQEREAYSMTTTHVEMKQRRLQTMVINTPMRFATFFFSNVLAGDL